MVSKKEEVLRRVRIVRKEKKMSYQSIVDALEVAGTPVSLSSVRRVFDEHFHADDFKYDTTLRPIVRFVLGMDEDFEDAESSALAAVVDYKDALVEHLESQITKLRSLIKFLIILSASLLVIVILCAILLEAYIVLDFDHPNWGLFFR